MMRIVSAALVLLAWAGAAQAYDLRTKSESELIGAKELADLVTRIGNEVGTSIPQSDQIRVHAFTQTKPRADKPDNGDILYDHRVELRKLFNSREQGPYPMAGWL